MSYTTRLMRLKFMHVIASTNIVSSLFCTQNLKLYYFDIHQDEQNVLMYSLRAGIYICFRK